MKSYTVRRYTFAGKRSGVTASTTVVCYPCAAFISRKQHATLMDKCKDAELVLVTKTPIPGVTVLDDGLKNQRYEIVTIY